MTIASRFATRCKDCGGPIAVGEQIKWVRGEGSRHIECQQPMFEVVGEIVAEVAENRGDAQDCA